MRRIGKRPLLIVSMTLVACGMVAIAPTAAIGEPLPSPLVYLRDIDETITQDMKYATENNFTGQRVPGYEAAECLLHRQAAKALAKVQLDLKALGMSLKVYDCYRPERAVKAFVAWTKKAAESPRSKRFHPNLSKQQLLVQGYIAASSTHSRGVAVDVALARLPLAETPVFDPTQDYSDCTATRETRTPDSGMDFGTGFDCFDVRSHTDSRAISSEQKGTRSTLVAAMAKHGFANYRREWWHFTFPVEGTAPSFDFPIPSYR